VENEIHCKQIKVFKDGSTQWGASLGTGRQQPHQKMHYSPARNWLPSSSCIAAHTTSFWRLGKAAD